MMDATAGPQEVNRVRGRSIWRPDVSGAQSKSISHPMRSSWFYPLSHFECLAGAWGAVHRGNLFMRGSISFNRPLDFLYMPGKTKILSRATCHTHENSKS